MVESPDVDDLVLLDIPPPPPSKRRDLAKRREQQQQRWKTSDLQVLIRAKRIESETTRTPSGRARTRGKAARISKTGDKSEDSEATLRWKDVEVFCKKNGVQRDYSQCKKRWEKLVTDFKKVKQYQRRLPAGEPSYFELNIEERRARSLPLSLLHECYVDMLPWVPGHGEDPDHVVDNSADDPIPVQSAQRASAFGVRLGGQEGFTRPSDGSPAGLEQQQHQRQEVGLHAEDRESSRELHQGLRAELPATMMETTTPNVSERKQKQRGWKRSRRSDDQFLKLANQYLKVMAADSGKRKAHEEDFLAFERQRHADLLAFEKVKHEEQMALDRQLHQERFAQMEKIGTDISVALREVSASLRSFATEVAKM